MYNKALYLAQGRQAAKKDFWIDVHQRNSIL